MELMNPLQFGFRKGVSKADALLFFIESFCKSSDSNNIVQNALLDLSKAFGSIFQDILIEELKKIGSDSDAQNLIISFVSNRFNLDLNYSNSIYSKQIDQRNKTQDTIIVDNN